MHALPAALACAALALGCTSTDEPAVVVRAFTLTAPDLAFELVPVAGELVDVGWTHDADHGERARVSIIAAPTGPGAAGEIAWGALTDGAARYVVPPGGSGLLPVPPPIPAGVYQLVGRVRADGVQLAESTAPGLLVMQGASFRERELTFTSDVTLRELWMTTVTATLARATVYLTTLAGDGRWVVSAATIASDLAPVGRVVTFTGRTIDDVAIPAGDYRARVEMSARGGTVTYTQGDLVVHWQP